MSQRLYSDELLAMDEEQAKSLREFNAKQTDWFTYCQVCGQRREGSLEDLKKPCDHDSPAR